jgi:hypothetical protein
LRHYKVIQFFLAILLIGASVNICLPWKSLKQTWVLLANDVGEEDQEEQSEQSRDQRDERDERDEREDNDEKEKLGFDKDYLGMQSSFHSLSFEINAWKCGAIGRLDRPVLDILIPPPKSNC